MTGHRRNGNNEATYVVTITATDPSGATGTATVQITVDGGGREAGISR